MSLVLKSNVAYTGDIRDLPYRYVFEGLACDALVGCSLLTSTYTGALMQVNRLSDNAKLEVFAKDGKYLDEQAVINFAGSSDVSVSILYDQSGNGHHFSRTDVVRQPFLIKGGVLQRDSQGLPALRYDAGNQALVARDIALSATTGVGFYLKGAFTDAAIANADLTRGVKSLAIGTYSGLNKFVYKSSDTDLAEKTVNIGGAINVPNTIKTYLDATNSTLAYAVNGTGDTVAATFTQMQSLDAVAIGSDADSFIASNNMKGLFSSFAIFSAAATADALF